MPCCTTRAAAHASHTPLVVYHAWSAAPATEQPTIPRFQRAKPTIETRLHPTTAKPMPYSALACACARGGSCEYKEYKSALHFGVPSRATSAAVGRPPARGPRRWNPRRGQCITRSRRRLRQRGRKEQINSFGIRTGGDRHPPAVRRPPAPCAPCQTVVRLETATGETLRLCSRSSPTVASPASTDAGASFDAPGASSACAPGSRLPTWTRTAAETSWRGSGDQHPDARPCGPSAPWHALRTHPPEACKREENQARDQGSSKGKIGADGAGKASVDKCDGARLQKAGCLRRA